MQLDQSKICHHANRRVDFQIPNVGVLVRRDTIGVDALNPNHLLTQHTRNQIDIILDTYTEYR